MITAIEIRNQSFKKTFRGYEATEVNNFMYQLAQDYEKLYSQNVQLKDHNQMLQLELQRYRKMEETMNNALIIAQQTAEDIKYNARKEAELNLEEAKKNIHDIMLVYQDIIKRLNIYQVELKAQALSQVDFLEKHEKKLTVLANFFYSKDLKEIMEKLDYVSLEEKTSHDDQ